LSEFLITCFDEVRLNHKSMKVELLGSTAASYGREERFRPI